MREREREKERQKKKDILSLTEQVITKNAKRIKMCFPTPFRSILILEEELEMDAWL
jgi:hypothetical protein